MDRTQHNHPLMNIFLQLCWLCDHWDGQSQPQLWGEQNFQKRWFLFWATLTWFKWNSNDLWSRIWVIPFFLSTSCLLCAIWIWGKGSLEILMMHSKIWSFYVVPASSVVSPYRWPLVSPLFSRWPFSWWQFEKAFLPQRRPLWSVSCSFCIFCHLFTGTAVW